MMEVKACAKVLGKSCHKEIGLSSEALPLILVRLAAAVGSGKCDGASSEE